MTTAGRSPRQPLRPSSKISTFDCMICMEENLPRSSGFLPGTNQCCKHCSSICRNCLALYISASVKQGKSVVWCPVPECNCAFVPCQELVAREVFDRWCDLLCESAVRDYERCYCPNPDCQELIIDECRASHPKKIQCPNCKESCCFQCSVPWDDRHKCDEVHVVIEMKQWTRCPGCKYYVERIEGCSSIVCRCQTRFCFNCGKKWDPQNFYCPCSREHRRMECIIVALIVLWVAINLAVLAWRLSH